MGFELVPLGNEFTCESFFLGITGISFNYFLLLCCNQRFVMGYGWGCMLYVILLSNPALYWVARRHTH